MKDAESQYGGLNPAASGCSSDDAGGSDAALAATAPWRPEEPVSEVCFESVS